MSLSQHVLRIPTRKNPGGNDLSLRNRAFLFEKEI